MDRSRRAGSDGGIIAKGRHCCMFVDMDAPPSAARARAALQNLRVWLVLEEPEQRRLLQRVMTEIGASIESCSYRQVIETVSEEMPDVILLGCREAQREAADLLAEGPVRAASVAVIVVGGEPGDADGQRAIEAGAADHVPQRDLTRPVLERALLYALELRHHRCQEISKARQEEKIRFQADLLDAVGQAVTATDLEGRILYWNRAAEKLFGWREEEVLGRPMLEITPTEESLPLASSVLERLRQGEEWSGELELRRKDGLSFPAMVTDAPVWNREERLSYIIGISSDLTERKALEEHAFQVQRLEAVGRLAGGVAHDFNNLLTVIGGHCSFLADALPEDSPLREHANQVQQGVRRASKLTNHLLTFSRRQMVDERVLDLGRALADLEPVLRRLLPERIDLRVELGRPPHRVRVDSGQLQQVVLNLVVNAMDAIEKRGSIRLRLGERTISEQEAEQIPWIVVPGSYARLTVEDSGCGIPAHLLDRIFEPFFTTKPVGAGTGLGLSMTYGVVKRARGHVMVSSEPGQGTTFEILLPQLNESEDPPEEIATEPVGSTRSIGHEGHCVMLVEDDPAVRILFQHVLERAGHRVLVAHNGRDALDLIERHSEEVRLVISDIVMPELGGAELMDRLRETHPHLKLVLMSGYPQRELSETDRLRVQAAAAFLRKPVSPNELTRAVRRVLERS